MGSGHPCQWDMSTFPSDGFLLEFGVTYCGKPASVRLDEAESEGHEIWSCAEHYDLYAQRPI